MPARETCTQASNGAEGGQPVRGQRKSDPKIGEHGAPTVIHKYILRLQVAVDDAGGMSCAKAVGHSDRKPQSAERIERSLSPNQLPQHALHRQQEAIGMHARSCGRATLTRVIRRASLTSSRK